jgi:hypothetical protein
MHAELSTDAMHGTWIKAIYIPRTFSQYVSFIAVILPLSWKCGGSRTVRA